MVPQNYQNWIEITSNIIHMVAFGVGFKCPQKIHLNTQWGGTVLPNGVKVAVCDQSQKCQKLPKWV